MIALDVNAKPKEGDAKQKMESMPIVENKAAVDSGGKSRRKLWIMIGVLVFMVVAAGFAFLAYPHFRGAQKASPASKAKQNSNREEVKAILALEPFLVNLADTDEIRFLKTTFQLGLAEAPDEEVKGPIMAAMRDSIISLLSSKTAEQILTPQGKDKLREEVRSRVNSISPKVKVLEVYIVDFVVQL
jgi:flagellar FliL protein